MSPTIVDRPSRSNRHSPSPPPTEQEGVPERAGRHESDLEKEQESGSAKGISERASRSPDISSGYIYLARVKDGLEDGPVAGTSEMSDLDQYEGVEQMYLLKEKGSPLGDEYYAGDDDDYEVPNPPKRRRGDGRQRRQVSDDEDDDDAAAGHQDVEEEDKDKDSEMEPPITRAELVDYLEHRERFTSAVLERIEQRLGLIEQRLTTTPNPPQTQVIPGVEKVRKRRPSTKSDPRLRQFIRMHTAIMLGINDLWHDDVPEPPSIEDTRRFEETGKGGPSKRPGEWRPDLNGSRRSPWNKAVAKRFRRNFLKCSQYGDWAAEDVEKALFVHMETLRSRYKDQTGQRTKGERIQINIKAARTSRLKTLTQQRMTACAHHEDLSDFLPYIKKLAEGDGMSGDESDNTRPGKYKGNAKYYRVRPAWRALALSKWLNVIDKVYVAYRFQENHRATPGNWVRKRYETNRVDQKAQPIRGLPKNFYDEAWLGTLTQEQQRSLKVAPQINLQHTSRVRRIALRYSDINKWGDIPREVETEGDETDVSMGVETE